MNFFKFISNHQKINFRHFIIYILIGFSSVLLEINLIKFFKIEDSLYKFIIFNFCVFFAFFLNYFYNFQSLKLSFNKSIIYFFFISYFSFFSQLILSNFFYDIQRDYNNSRLIFSGFCFIYFYYLHLKFSFKEIKRIGIAVYPEKDNNFADIFNKTKILIDFIHIDIIDNTLYDTDKNFCINTLNKILEQNSNYNFHMHLMSKNLDIIDKYSSEFDVIFVHYDVIRKNIEYLNNVKVGIAFHHKEKIDYKFLSSNKKNIKNILYLNIEKPGISGQKFDDASIPTILNLNKYCLINKIEFFLDGGVNLNVIKKINVKNYITYSSIVNSVNPYKSLMKLKFYEK